MYMYTVYHHALFSIREWYIALYVGLTLASKWPANRTKLIIISAKTRFGSFSYLESFAKVAIPGDQKKHSKL